MIALVLKLFGYREKSADAPAVIETACIINEEAKRKLERIRGTLNGEDDWLRGSLLDRGDWEKLYGDDIH